MIDFNGFEIKEGETSPPKRYNSGSMILAMENAGQLIEDEELRAQIKGSGIGTSATRAEILKKIKYHKIYFYEQKDTGYHTDITWRNYLRCGGMFHEAAFKSGADGKLGKGTDLCRRGQYHLTGIYG